MIHSTCKFKAPHNSTTSLLRTTKSPRLSSSFWPGVEVGQIVQVCCKVICVICWYDIVCYDSFLELQSLPMIRILVITKSLELWQTISTFWYLFMATINACGQSSNKQIPRSLEGKFSTKVDLLYANNLLESPLSKLYRNFENLPSSLSYPFVMDQKNIYGVIKLINI